MHADDYDHIQRWLSSYTIAFSRWLSSYTIAYTYSYTYTYTYAYIYVHTYTHTYTRILQGRPALLGLLRASKCSVSCIKVLCVYLHTHTHMTTLDITNKRSLAHTSHHQQRDPCTHTHDDTRHRKQWFPCLVHSDVRQRAHYTHPCKIYIYILHISMYVIHTHTHTHTRMKIIYLYITQGITALDIAT